MNTKDFETVLEAARIIRDSPEVLGIFLGEVHVKDVRNFAAAYNTKNPHVWPRRCDQYPIERRCKIHGVKVFSIHTE